MVTTIGTKSVGVDVWFPDKQTGRSTDKATLTVRLSPIGLCEVTAVVDGWLKVTFMLDVNEVANLRDALISNEGVCIDNDCTGVHDYTNGRRYGVSRLTGKPLRGHGQEDAR